MPLTALYRFTQEDLNPGEFVIYRAHLNAIAFLFAGQAGLFLIFIGFLILALAYYFREGIGFLEENSITLGVILFAGLFLVWGGVKFGRRLVDWLYDEDMITNQRVIDYNQKFLFSKDVSTASMKSVENILLIQDGIIRSIFNYGNLGVQTAASGAHSQQGQLGRYLLLENISRPKKIQRLIDETAYRSKKQMLIDRDELLIMCGLKRGNLDDYFVVKKTRGWKKRVQKLLKWKE